MIRVFIDGSEGTTGLRIHSRLSARADIALISIESALRKDAEARRRCILQSDVTFLCLPDAAAIEAAALAGNEKVCIIDASTAHRTAPGWAYGFPELSAAHRAAIEAAPRISVPGCHASGFLALVYPLVASGMLPPDDPLVCHSLTGYTGGGKRMIAQYEDPARSRELDSPRQYALGQMHKHLREMKAIAGLAHEPAFSPIVTDFPQGMAVTVPIFPRRLTGKPNLAALHALFSGWYADASLVRVRPLGAAPDFLAANALAGRDDMEIFVAGNDERALLIARFDNLGKGASGAALQCFNIRMDLPETEGLIF